MPGVEIAPRGLGCGGFMGRIEVEIGAPGADIAADWPSLVARAAVNVFLSPAALNAAAATKFAKIHVLRAWDAASPDKTLVGLWAFEERRFLPLWPAFLAAPPYNYAFVSTPMIDPAVMDEVAAAFLAAVETSGLPNVIRLELLDGDSAAGQAILRALSTRRSKTLTLSEHPRPYLPDESGLKRSGSTRKKLRQDWNRLAALGAADVVNDRTPAAVRDALEVFLRLEAASWKGASGTALLNDAKDAAFARRLIGDLADQGSASVALLRVDGKPVAAQVLLYGGTMAYTWKTAFDAEFAKYSPGTLLVDKVTEELFATHGITAIESCSPEKSFMAQLWSGRRKTVDLLADVGARPSLNFALAVVVERGYVALKALRDRLRAASWPKAPKPGLPAPR
jgi:CelD/BcsL family acetyltransferase involved in cellulose biosynthesis